MQIYQYQIERFAGGLQGAAKIQTVSTKRTITSRWRDKISR